MRRRLSLVGIVLAMAAGRASGLELEEVVRQIEHSVVRVETDTGLGSGVVVDDAGLVLTNFHVIDDARSATVELRSNQTLEVIGFVAVDPRHDLALLKTRAMSKPVAMRLAKELPGIGAKVAAFGNPKGLSFTTSEGIVSAIRTGKEISEVLGELAYRAQGYSTAATWIQTTAPISPGNSGGPLVTMNAELVGLNTWSHVGGQNLNFAIALPDIEDFLRRHRNEKEQPLAKLPRKSRVRIDLVPKGIETIVKLPNGAQFSYEIFETKQDALVVAAKGEQGGSHVVFSYPNGTMQAAAQQRGGRLHGVTIGQYENEMPMVFANYDEGDRHGLLKTWNNEGERMLYGQYLKGRRNGFVCFHVKDKLALLLLYQRGQLTWIQLMSGPVPLEGFATLEAAKKHTAAAKLLDELEDYDKKLKQDEFKFKNTVRELETDLRRQRASALAPSKRARIMERGEERSSAVSGFMESMRRRTHGF